MEISNAILNDKDMESSDIITRQEALSFLSDVLCVASPAIKLDRDREAFLNDVIRAWHHHIPYQTVSNIATPPLKRHVPSLAEIKKDNLAKIGGLCYHLNIFCLHVLRVLGFDVSLTSFIIGPGNEHPVIIVHDLTSEASKHLVDVGFGAYPTLCAIPLDFHSKSNVYHHSFVRYRLVRKDGFIHREHSVESDPIGAARFHMRVQTDGWYSFMYFNPDIKLDISYFEEIMIKRYTKVEPLPDPPLLSSMRILVYPEGRLVYIKDTTLLVEGEEGSVQKSYFRSRDEILSAFDRFFPKFPKDVVEAAMDDENVYLDFCKGL